MTRKWGDFHLLPPTHTTAYPMWTKLLYELDKLIKRGLGIQLGLLFGFVLLIAVIGSLLISLLMQVPYGDLLWLSSMHILDAGTIAGQDRGDSLIPFFIILTFVGLFIWSAVVAILNEGLHSKLDELQHGIVQLQEKNHIVILGWGDEVPALLEEYSNTGIKTVVILSEHEQEDIQAYAPKGMELIVRSGNPQEQRILSLFCIEQARAVVIVEEDDMNVLKIVLALKKLFPVLPMQLVAIVQDASTREVVESLQTKDFRIRCINKWEILASLTAQGIVFAGAASVYDDLFSISGNKIITQPAAPHAAKGMKKLAQDMLSKGDLLLGYVSAKGESFLGCTEDDQIPADSDIVLLSTDGVYEEPPVLNSTPNKNNNILIVADKARDKVAPYVEQYAEYIPNQYILSFEELQAGEANFEDGKKGTLAYLQNFITERQINKVLLLSENEEEDVEVIALLIFFRHLRQKMQLNLSMLSLLSSARNRELVAYDTSDDFIVSGKLIGAMLGQASLYPKLDAVFTDLLDADGLELGEVAISPELVGKTFEQAYVELFPKNRILIGVCNNKMHLRPDKSMQLKEGDRLLIIADFI